MIDKKKILIIDSNNMLYRAFCASPLLNTNGEHIGAITGYFYSLQKMVKDVRPHFIYNIWDGAGGSQKRRQIRSDYKEGRKPPKSANFNRAHDIQQDPDQEKKSLYYQQRRVVEYLNYFPFIQLCESGVEADDFISYLCNLLNCENNLKIIVSNDKDFIQLTDECTILYRPAEKAYITHKKFLKEEGIHPKNMALSRAIEGDSSDNLSGVPGVGRKTIVKHFRELGEEKSLSIDELIQLCESKKDCKPAIKILEHINVVKQNYEIMQLYMPMVNFTAKHKIDAQINDYVPTLSYLEFVREAEKDGILGSSFKELMLHSQNMIIDWSNDHKK